MELLAPDFHLAQPQPVAINQSRENLFSFLPLPLCYPASQISKEQIFFKRVISFDIILKSCKA